MRVLIVDADHDLTALEKDFLRKERPEWQVDFLPLTTDRDAVLAAIREHDLLISAFTKLDADFFAAPGELKAVSVNAIGFDTVDVDAAACAGVSVFSLTNYCTEEVAEHTVALMMAITRRLLPYTDRQKTGVWSFMASPRPRRITGQTLAVFGFGRIGQAVARRAMGLGMKILAVDPFGPFSTDRPENAWLKDVEFVSREEAFARADVISNHMAQTDENVHYFDAAAFSMMKKKPIFVNCARGMAVDTEALMAALRSGQIFGAGLDVLEEIRDAPELLSEGLNLIITPHAAFYSETSATKLAHDATWNLIHFTEDEPDEITRVLVWKGVKK